MKAFVDRIENDMAVLLLGEDGNVQVNVPLSWLPPDVSEGIYLDVTFTVDKDTTKRAKDDVQALLESMDNEP